ncbi:hypothetical protein C8J57DRAFT_1527737 [Mycena rebaudengoi]|nr:hypothetical protein C8J57DRAFT_1531241 [Mycena rebaudengoi]KAJ7240294.1 hypothetical protein C8J57DRAFT_1527736 [Mycena rebaudengoi]KAJ7240295.1 hypothetical protein C8J57DRAFT_1527737 [Mycena rebaudengoi]
MKIALTSFLVTVQLAVAQAYNWRLYNNGGCDNSSPASATFPPLPAPPRSNDVIVCVTTPQGIPWNRLEVDIRTGPLDIFTFSNANCTGSSLETIGSSCNSAPCDSCAIGSFIAFPPTSVKAIEDFRSTSA